jgi:iron complex outermembrane receptor protein
MSYTDSYVIANPSLYGPLAGALANKQRYRQGKYALFNGSITWVDPEGHYSVSLWGRNLGNKSYRATYNGGPFGDYSVPADPLTYGVALGFRF